ncbi:MAG: lysophospholipid acyltransferase family protein [Pseudomonadota bacterium]
MHRYFRFIRLIFLLFNAFFIIGFSRDNNKLIQQGLDEKKVLGLQKCFKKFLLLLNINIVFHGEPVQSPKMIVCNHVSWVDVVILISIYPGHFIAKSEIRSWPILGAMVCSAGTLFIKRGLRSEIKKLGQQIEQIIKNKSNVVFFPEGATGDGKQINTIYSGLFESAIIAGMDVQPMLVIYNDSSGYPSEKIPYVGEQHLLSSIWTVLGEKQITAHLFALESLSSKEYTRKEIGKQVGKLLSLKLAEEIND